MVVHHPFLLTEVAAGVRVSIGGREVFTSTNHRTIAAFVPMAEKEAGTVQAFVWKLVNYIDVHAYGAN